MSQDHECVFVEEQEPSGRLILPPCIVCGCTAIDALDQLRPTDRKRGVMRRLLARESKWWNR
jgi:hypothetical protein